MAEGERRVRGWCPLCRSRCGAIAVVQGGRLAALEPDPEHPTGQALCAKGRAAPELVHDPGRLLHPMVRTRPKGDPDPGWRRVSWDEALDLAATRLRTIAAESGPEAVAFSVTSPSGTALSDAIHWIERLVRAFGSPNTCYATEICNWHKDVAHAFTVGRDIAQPDLARAGALVLWGHNPSTGWLARVEKALAARRRGMRLVVVDPRHAGLAAKADQWLRVRPGTDGALALALAAHLIEEGWYDRDYVRDRTSGPLLVREDSGRFLRAHELGRAGDRRYVAWDETAGRPLFHDPEAGREPHGEPALCGRFEVATPEGTVACRPAFDRFAELCRRMPPARAAGICWVPATQIRDTAKLLWESRPVAYYAWSGVGQQDNATQTDRAIALLMALLGSHDAAGGNRRFAKPPLADLSGRDLIAPEQAAKALGLAARPLGPPRDGYVTSDDLYRAILAGEPYRVRALVGFGANLLLSHADPGRAAAALGRLDFYVHADLTANPTAAFADLLLPVASAFEREGLRGGFEVDEAAEALLQWRAPALPPQGEARSDARIVFDLAVRLGLADAFWGGNLERGWAAMLAPTGISLAELRARPGGIRWTGPAAPARRFATPTGRVEIYSEALHAIGQSPLPEYREPAVGPLAPAEIADRFPLVLTSAKSPTYCHGQHRQLPSLRRVAPDPEIEMHPETARLRGVAEGSWVEVESPAGKARFKARFSPHLAQRVVVAQHGWWQACPALGRPGYDPLADDGANYNRLIRDDAADPVSGSVPHRAYLCEVRPVA